MIKKFKPFLSNFLIISSTSFICILFFDFICYLVISESFTHESFPKYKWKPTKLNPFYKKNEAISRLRNYYSNHPVRGFDINKSLPVSFFDFTDARLEVFSNELGCWDKNSKEEIINSENFAYIAGDSFTWGYANYKNIYPNVYEKLSGETTLKCGVPHTGQLHQFNKFKSIINEIGAYPKDVIIGYYLNDPSNDNAYPHSKVIKGVRVETSLFDISSKSLIPINSGQTTFKVNQELKKLSDQKLVFEKEENPFRFVNIKNFISQYSLSSNLINSLVKSFRIKPLDSIYNSQSLYSHSIDYANNFYTKKNREIIKEWKKDSIKNKYNLTFLLIPPSNKFNDINLYSDFKLFLKLNQINFVDATQGFKDSKISRKELYWYHDGHLSNMGNEFLGRYLHEKLIQSVINQ